MPIKITAMLAGIHVLCFVLLNLRLVRIIRPVAHLPGISKPSVAVRCGPLLYSLRGNGGLIDLPYRMVYAVATLDAVLIYDTQQTTPLAYIGSMHYGPINDIAWYVLERKIYFIRKQGNRFRPSNHCG